MDSVHLSGSSDLESDRENFDKNFDKKCLLGE